MSIESQHWAGNGARLYLNFQPSEADVYVDDGLQVQWDAPFLFVLSSECPACYTVVSLPPRCNMQIPIQRGPHPCDFGRPMNGRDVSTS
jgi:hypothetical protein